MTVMHWRRSVSLSLTPLVAIFGFLGLILTSAEPVAPGATRAAATEPEESADWSRQIHARIPSRTNSAMAESSDGVVLFGGSARAGIALDDTWTWDGLSWTQELPTTSPAGRFGAAIAYDPETSTTVLFGGARSAPLEGNTLLGDTWIWDGSSWEVVPAGPNDPEPREDAMFATAPGQKLVLFGGNTGGDIPADDTWLWDGKKKSWTKVTPEAYVGGGPPARAKGAAAYNPMQNVTVLFGGDDHTSPEDFNDTWTWDGSLWTEVSPHLATSPCRGAGRSQCISPAGRIEPGMAYAGSVGRVALFGGNVGSSASPFDDTWSWDGTAWMEHEGQRPPPDVPLNGMASWNSGSGGVGTDLGFSDHVVVLSYGVAVETPDNDLNIPDFQSSDAPMETWTWDGAARLLPGIPEPDPPSTRRKLAVRLSDDVIPADGRSEIEAMATVTVGGEPASGLKVSWSAGGGDVTLHPSTCSTNEMGSCAIAVRASLTPGNNRIDADAAVVTGSAYLTEEEARCSSHQPGPSSGPPGWWANVDRGFGCLGRAFPRPFDGVSDMEILRDGKIVALARSGSADSFLMRYGKDGQIDAEFGKGNRSLYAPGIIKMTRNHRLLAVQDDQKIVTAERIVTTAMSDDEETTEAVVSRFNADGTPDNGDRAVDSTPGDSFGQNGSISVGEMRALALAVYNSNGETKILVAGVNVPPYSPTTSYPAILARYNGDGTVDRSFGSFDSPGGARSGRRNFAFREDALNTAIASIAIQPVDGEQRILLGGGYGSGFGLVSVASHWGLARLDENGELDGTFNACPSPDGECGGKSLPVFDSNLEALADMTIQQHDGKIVAVGGSRQGRLQIARFGADGRMDAGFNSCASASPPCGGKVSTGFGGSAFGEAVAVQSDRRIVVGGSGANQQASGLLIARLNPDGSLDESCGFSPYSVTDYAGSRQAKRVGFQEDGTVIAGGTETILAFEGGGPSLFNRVSLQDVTVTEPTSGQRDADFDLTLENAGCEPVSVDWTTAEDPGAPDGAQAGSDYTPRFGTVTFAPGDTSETVEVPVLGDTVPEGTERFFVDLSNPRVGAASSLTAGRPGDLLSSPVTLADPRGTATILDAGPAVAVSDVTVTEPDSGSVPAPFTVSLNGETDHDVSVSYTTENGTATEPGDYTARSRTLTIPEGEVSRTVEVPVVGDTVPEKTEEFGLRITSVDGAAIADAEGAGTILDTDTADRPPPDPTLSVGDVRVSEGDADTPATLTVSLNRAPGRDVSVSFTTVDGTAEAGADFLARSGTLAFGPDDQAKTVAVTIVGDQVPEPTEELYLDLSNPRGAVLERARGTITIDDDDAPPPPPEEVVDPTERPPDPTERPREPTGAPPAPPPAAGATEVASTPPPVPPGPIAATAALAAVPPLPSATSPPGVALGLPPILPPPSLLQLPVQQPATNAQSQFQTQAQVQQQAQAAAQAAFMAQRERQAEVESARTDRRDANPEGYLASARRRPALVSAAALAWVASLVAMGLGTAFGRGGQRAAVNRVPRQRRRPGR